MVQLIGLRQWRCSHVSVEHIWQGIAGVNMTLLVMTSLSLESPQPERLCWYCMSGNSYDGELSQLQDNRTSSSHLDTGQTTPAYLSPSLRLRQTDTIWNTEVHLLDCRDQHVTGGGKGWIWAKNMKKEAGGRACYGLGQISPTFTRSWCI